MGKAAMDGLRPNMVEVLERLASGETVEEIARVWAVTPRMVQQTVAKARAQLGARTVPHAIAVFISRNGHKPR